MITNFNSSMVGLPTGTLVEVGLHTQAQIKDVFIKTFPCLHLLIPAGKNSSMVRPDLELHFLEQALN